jgi:hypothetical protein
MIEAASPIAVLAATQADVAADVLLREAAAARDRGSEGLWPEAWLVDPGRPGDRRVSVECEEQGGAGPAGGRQASVVAGLSGRAGHLGEQIW